MKFDPYRILGFEDKFSEQEQMEIRRLLVEFKKPEYLEGYAPELMWMAHYKDRILTLIPSVLKAEILKFQCADLGKRGLTDYREKRSVLEIIEQEKLSVTLQSAYRYESFTPSPAAPVHPQ